MMLTITIKPAIQMKLEQAADMTGQSIDEIVEQALQHHLERLADQQLEAEIRAFEQQHALLKEKYLGQFIAMHGGQVVDTATEIEPLYLRIQERFGDQTVLIRRVEETPDEVYHFPGVRMEPTV